jgi:hypothetical protein
MAPSPAHETFPLTAGRDMRWTFLSSPYLLPQLARVSLPL